MVHYFFVVIIALWSPDEWPTLLSAVLPLNCCLKL